MPKNTDEENKRMIQTYYMRFVKAETAVTNLHQKIKELDTFDRGEQWKDASIPPWVPKPVTNYQRYFRTLKRANLASSIPKPSFAPIRQEFQEQVQNLSDAYEHVWEEENLPRLIRKCVDRSLIQGTAIAYVYNDEDYIGGVYYEEGDKRNNLFKGKIKIKRWPIMNFFPDPDAYDVYSMKWCETTEIIPLTAVKGNKTFRKYAGDDKIDSLIGDNIDHDDDADGTILDRDTKPGTFPYYNDDKDQIITLHCHYERYYNEDTHKWQLDITYYTKRNYFPLYRIEDAKPNLYPFAFLYMEEEEQDIFGSGIAQDTIDNQKIVNKADQTASILGVLNQNPQKVVSRESGINAQDLARSGTLPGKTWTANGDPSKAVHIIQPPDVPRGLFEVKDRMVNDMKETVGVNQAYAGDRMGSLTTSTGVNALIERATIRDRDTLIQVNQFVEDLSHLIVLFILYHWKESRPIMKMNPNGTPQFGTYTPVDKLTADNLEWRVKSDVYARAPVTQALLKQQADNLMQMQGQFQFNPPIITPEEWIQMQDFATKEEMMQRMQADRQRLQAQEASDMANQIAQAAQQVSQAIGQGMAPQQVQQIALQAAQQILQQKQAQDEGQAVSAANQQQGPRGTTGALAMQNMAQGS